MHPKAIIVCAVALVALGVFASLRLAGKPNDHGKKYSVYKFASDASLPFAADRALVYVNHDYKKPTFQEELDHTNGPDNSLNTQLVEDWNEGYVEAVVGTTRYIVSVSLGTYQEFVDDVMVDCWKYIASDFSGDVNSYEIIAKAAETLEFVTGTDEPPNGAMFDLAQCFSASGKGDRARRTLAEEREQIAQHIKDNHVLLDDGSLVSHEVADRRLGEEGGHRRMLRPTCKQARDYAELAYDKSEHSTSNFGKNRCYKPNQNTVAISGSDDSQLEGARRGIAYKNFGCSGCSWGGCSGCSWSHEYSLGGSKGNDWYCNLWANDASGSVKACYKQYADATKTKCGRTTTCTGHSLGGGSCAVGQHLDYWQYAIGFNPVPAINHNTVITGTRYIYRKDVASQCGYRCATSKIANGQISISIPGWMRGILLGGTVDVRNSVKNKGNSWSWGYKYGYRTATNSRYNTFGRNDCVRGDGRAQEFSASSCNSGSTWDIIFELVGSVLNDVKTNGAGNTASDHSELSYICDGVPANPLD